LLTITNNTPVAEAEEELAEHGLRMVRSSPKASGFFQVTVEDIAWGGLYTAYGYGWVEATLSAARTAFDHRAEQRILNILGSQTCVEAIKKASTATR
jgi:hypothetical protein